MYKDDEINLPVANFVTSTLIQKRGLGDGIGLKKSCHHLGTYLYLYLFIFLRKKMKSVKKVTKLPALTVQG